MKTTKTNERVRKTPYAELLHTLRRWHGLSQEECASRLGMSRSSWIWREKGVQELTFSEARDVAKLFSITLDELASGAVVRDIVKVLTHPTKKK